MAVPRSNTYTGWWNNRENSRGEFYINGTEVARLSGTSFNLLAALTSGLTVTAGGLTVTAGDVLITGGRLQQNLAVTDDDSQNMTLAAADIVAGINVHTTTTGGGTVTTDTAANIISTCGLNNNDDTIISYYINDGTQTATFSAGNNVTIADTGQTVAADESAMLLWRRTSGTAVTLYIIGA